MEIHSFLPAYPSRSGEWTFVDLFPGGFTSSIAAKKEFQDLTVRPKGTFVPQKQQVYASRYMSRETLYDGTLIFHTMGSGKTPLAILTCETNFGNSFKGAVICIPSTSFEETFIREIIKVTGKKYFPPNESNLLPDQINRAVRKNIRKVYTFITFLTFANAFEKSLESSSLANVRRDFRRDFSNRLIIVDEVHNLRIQKETPETSRMNRAFNVLLHSVENAKILLMTGTPMRDHWSELPDILNLILPENEQLPSGKEFGLMYRNDGKTIDNEEKLRDLLRGRVSALRGIVSNVRKEFIGEFLGERKLFRLDAHKMERFQEEVYMKAFDDEGRSGKNVGQGLRTRSQQASLFVFPDGSFGDEGFKKYLRKPGKKTNYSMPTINPELHSALKDMKGLQKHSIKYAKAVQDILACRGKGLTILYISSVSGGGAILFARILELYGYSRTVKGESESKAWRYAILTSETLDQSGGILRKIQEQSNRPENVLGEFISVIIISKTASEGISFSNAVNIGVLTPFWNYSTIDQAIARGIRVGSHKEIQRVLGDITVNIHHYVALAESEYTSIDMIMYEKSQEKDVRIKRGERLLKEIAVDCPNNLLVNSSGQDFTRECDYLECKFQCDNYVHLPQDTATYNMIFSDDEVELIIRKIQDLFKHKFSYSLGEMKEILSEHELPLIIRALRFVIFNSLVVRDRFGFSAYVREFENRYFLVRSTTETSPYAEYYTSHPIVSVPVSLQEIIGDVKSNETLSLLDGVCKENIQDFFSLPKDLQEDLFEAAVDAEEQKLELKGAFRASIFEKIKPMYILDAIVSPIANRCRIDGVWGVCPERIIEEMNKQKEEQKGSLENNPYRIYAIVNRSMFEKKTTFKGSFWIRDVSLRNAKNELLKGRKCGEGELKVGRMALYALRLGLEQPPGSADPKKIKALKDDKFVDVDFTSLTNEEINTLAKFYSLTAEKLCERLYKWFESKNLIEYTDKTNMR